MPQMFHTLSTCCPWPNISSAFQLYGTSSSDICGKLVTYLVDRAIHCAMFFDVPLLCSLDRRPSHPDLMHDMPGTQ